MSVAPFVRPDWPAPAHVHAAVTTRHWQGAWLPPSGQAPGVSEPQTERLIAALGLPQAPRWLRQQHGIEVIELTDAVGDVPSADAALTRAPGVVLAVRSADCLPILVTDSQGSEIAAIHAGWRGLSSGVIEATLGRLEAPPGRLLAWLGPAAGATAYEVGAEVRDALLGGHRDAAKALVASRPGHWWCDLYALARQRLAAVGVSRVYGGNCCTIADADRFYSHRRAAEPGRMASLIWIG